MTRADQWNRVMQAEDLARDRTLERVASVLAQTRTEPITNRQRLSAVDAFEISQVILTAASLGVASSHGRLTLGLHHREPMTLVGELPGQCPLALQGPREGEERPKTSSSLSARRKKAMGGPERNTA